MEHIGMHCLLELFGCPAELLDDPEFIARALREAAENAGATWLGQLHHRFAPKGVTCIGLLAESHISIHTWPEKGYAAVDVFTCGDAAMPEHACELIATEMRAARSTLARIPRAVTMSEPDEPAAPLAEPAPAIEHDLLRAADAPVLGTDGG